MCFLLYYVKTFRKGGLVLGGIIWFIFWQGIGILLGVKQFRAMSLPLRVYLGSVCGTLLAVWLPVPFSFLFGFSLQSHVLSILCGLSLLGCLLSRRRQVSVDLSVEEKKKAALFLALSLPLFVYCVCILLSHTLPERNGALYTGQCTFGDMAMHLGFITSLAEQGQFPPEYSILPGQRLCYPFLCDSVSASLLLLGTPLRWAYMLPAFFALMQVFAGFYALATAFCRKKGAAALSFVFFFFNGGFGLLYFIKDHSFSELFTGFYHTPTNLTDKGIRWVNVIVDILLPQRATLFGWAALFAAIWLLYRALFLDEDSCLLPAGVIGGLLPMLHTHSYLSLGFVAFSWLLFYTIRARFSRRSLSNWLKFGVPAVLLAVPQLLLWTFHSVEGNEQFLRLHWDWVNNGQENWLWFWLKNVGPLFLLSPIAFAFSDHSSQAFALPGLMIFLVCECVVFQPNVYDNNKLLYISYALFCILSADWLLSRLALLKIRPLRNTVLVLILLLCVNAAVLTMTREWISGSPRYAYRLFSAGDAAAADFIRDHTDADSLFLTSSNHNNVPAALAGRNVFCGCPSYLFYHGLDYESRLELARRLLTDSRAFEEMHASLGIDYVYIGEYERSLPGCCEPYFADTYPLVFSQGSVRIYQIMP